MDAAPCATFHDMKRDSTLQTAAKGLFNTTTICPIFLLRTFRVAWLGTPQRGVPTFPAHGASNLRPPPPQVVDSYCDPRIYPPSPVSRESPWDLINLMKCKGPADRYEWRHKRVVSSGEWNPCPDKRAVCLRASRSELLREHLSILEDVASLCARYPLTGGYS